MSDPTIQTFCCHHTGNKEDLAIRIMGEFNTDSYNAVCLVSSAIGILGAIYQIFPNISKSQFGMSLTRSRRVIIWLAVADLFASFGVLVRSSLWLKYKNIMPMPDDDVSVLFCSITSFFPGLQLSVITISLVVLCAEAWTQYFYTATWFWTLFYAIDTWNTIKGRDSNLVLYHSLSWGLPAATTGIGLSILYIPNATCHNLPSASTALYKILPNYFATYVPIAIVMIANPIIYTLSSRNVEMAIALPLAQFTSKERRVADALRLKFFFINMVFYVCWLPNLVNGILLWTMWFSIPVKLIISIWYIMALLNPMQALFNALVYRKWNTNKWTLSSSGSVKELLLQDEQSPLLSSEPPRLQLLSPVPPSINNYATL